MFILPPEFQYLLHLDIPDKGYICASFTEDSKLPEGNYKILERKKDRYLLAKCAYAKVVHPGGVCIWASKKDFITVQSI